MPKAETLRHVRHSTHELCRTGASGRLLLKVEPDWSGHVEFVEEYRSPDSDSPIWYSVRTPYASIGALVRFLEAKLGRGGTASDSDLDRRLVTCFGDLIRSGHLPIGQPPGELRNRVAGWCREARIGHDLGGITSARSVLLSTADSFGQSVELCVSTTAAVLGKQVEFAEQRSPGWSLHQVLTPFATVDRLVSYLSSQLAVRPVAGDPHDRLVACLRGFVERGALDPSLPDGECAARVARWCAAAGVPYARDAALREHTLLRVDDRSTGRAFSLKLAFNVWKVDFTEQYEYPNADYSYSVAASYSSLEPLVAYFESLAGGSRAVGHPDVRAVGDPGSGAGTDLERRLVDSFAAVIRRNAIGDGMPFGTCRDWVVARFTAADVPFLPSSWSWGEP